MTYCVGLCLADGMVLLSDTRTNAGVDNISIFSKMHIFSIPDERFLTLLTAGNLAVAQAVVNLLHEGIETEERLETLYTAPTMFRAAADGPTSPASRGAPLATINPRLRAAVTSGSVV